MKKKKFLIVIIILIAALLIALVVFVYERKIENIEKKMKIQPVQTHTPHSNNQKSYADEK